MSAKNTFNPIKFQLGLEFAYMGLDFTGIAEEIDNTYKLIAFTSNADIRNILANHGVTLPKELDGLDLTVKMLCFSMDSGGEVGFFGTVEFKNEKLGGDPGELGNANLQNRDKKFQIGDEKLDLASVEFEYVKSRSINKCSIIAKGGNIPRIAEIDAQIKEFKFEFEYEKDGDKKADWHIGGKLQLEAFERLLAFKAEVAQLDGDNSLVFEAESKPILEEAYFSDIKGLDFGSLKQELLAKGILKKTSGQDQYQLKGNIKTDSLQFSKPFNQFKQKIIDVLEKINRAKEALIKIPDILNNGKTLFAVDPIEFKIKLERDKGKFTKFGFSISSDLTLYNTWQKYAALLKIERGTLASSYDKEKKEFRLSFNTENCEIKPLNIVSLVPGMSDALHTLYKDKAKEKAFMNMLSLHPVEFHFIKNKDGYDVGGSIKLFLNDELKTVNEDLYAALDKIFPCPKDGRYLEGDVSYSSAEGLLFELTNNNGIEVPNLFEDALKKIPSELKDQISKDIDFDLDKAFDFGQSYMLLEQIRLAVKKKVALTAIVAFGLPSKLNDRLFGTSKLNGLINTYDRGSEKTHAAHKNNQVQENIQKQDGLLRASLTVGTEGVTGQLVKSDLLNKAKLDELAKDLTGFIVEKEDALIIDFDMLATDNSSEKSEEQRYGKISIEKPKFSLNLKNGSFSASGGFDILSEHLNLPVRSVFEKILAFLPLSESNSAIMKKLTNQLTDSISIKSLDFIRDNKLNLNEMEIFFKQFLLEKDQKREFIPSEFSDLIEKESGQILKHFPKRFKDYLGIKIPKGLHFKIEISADKSISFQLEVPENEQNKDSDFSDCIQLLFPDFSIPVPVNWYGIRLRKIGFGTALFNQCFRLALSMEIDQFNLIQIAAGVGISEMREKNKKLDFMLPDPDEFCQTFETRNLMVLIFILRVPVPIPIPVPVFYDKLYLKYFGLEGSGSEFNIELPAPELDIMKVFKELNNCINFFKSGSTSLPVPSHALAKTDSENKNNDSLLRPFEAGPIYIELPAVFGYEKKGKNKNKIRLGFSGRKELHAIDLIHMGANILKCGILSLKEKKPLSIGIDGTNLKELPVNYLIKYLPAEQRINSKDIVLFDLFEMKFSWALAAPNEFDEDQIRTLLRKEQNISPPSKNKSSALINSSDPVDDAQGVLLFYKFRGDCLDSLVSMDIFALSELIISTTDDTSHLVSRSDLSFNVKGKTIFHAAGEIIVNDDGFLIHGSVDISKILPISLQCDGRLIVSKKGALTIALEITEDINVGGLELAHGESNLHLSIGNDGLFLHIISLTSLLENDLSVDGKIQIHQDGFSGLLSLDLKGKNDLTLFGHNLKMDAQSSIALTIDKQGSSIDIKSTIDIPHFCSTLIEGKLTTTNNGLFNSDVSGSLYIGGPKGTQSTFTVGLKPFTAILKGKFELKFNKNSASISVPKASLKVMGTTHTITDFFIDTKKGDFACTSRTALSIGDPKLLQFTGGTGATISLTSGKLKIKLPKRFTATVQILGVKNDLGAKNFMTDFEIDILPKTIPISIPSLKFGVYTFPKADYRLTISEKNKVSLILKKSVKSNLKILGIRSNADLNSFNINSKGLTGKICGKIKLGKFTLNEATYSLSNYSKNLIKCHGSSTTKIFNKTCTVTGDILSNGKYSFTGSMNGSMNIKLAKVTYTAIITISDKTLFKGKVIGTVYTWQLTVIGKHKVKVKVKNLINPLKWKWKHVWKDLLKWEWKKIGKSSSDISSNGSFKLLGYSFKL